MTSQLAVKPQDSAPTTQNFRVLVKSIVLVAHNTLTVEFVSADGVEIPPFGAGAHIDLDLPNGVRRSYSLCNAPAERGRYVIGVRKADPGRGGSAYIHDQLKCGEVISISAPRNNFELDRNATLSVLIAGGIGVTPIWSMIQDLEARRRKWRLYYAARTRDDAAFLSDIRALAEGRPELLDIRFDREPGGRLLEIGAIIAAHADPGTHFYCCGPGPMLTAFEEATRDLPPERAHLERFGAEQVSLTKVGPIEFDIVLARSGATLHVARDKSVLETLLDAGVDVPYSCMNGVCGSCRIEVLDGVPEHNDMVLTDDERASNSAIMVCCSRSLTQSLVLDV